MLYDVVCTNPIQLRTEFLNLCFVIKSQGTTKLRWILWGS